MKRKLLLEGQWVETGRWSNVTSPFDAHPVSEVAQASKAEVERALSAAFSARRRLQGLSTGQRREVLLGVAGRLQAASTEMAQLICEEAGKPINSARTEVNRAIETFTLAAAELARFGGEIVPVDFAAYQAGAECEVRRFPAGVVVGIVPFNFPLNLGAHKVAPALAVGAPIIVKPPPQAPSAQLMLAEMVRESGADPAALQVLPCDDEAAEQLATDPRVRVVSFTGSARVGWMLKKKVPGKIILELGGNAGAVVAADADLDRAAQRLAASAFSYAGQVCIKVQRIVAVREVYDAFVERFIRETEKVKVGDPRSGDTVVGPVIDDAAAHRITEWVDEAVKLGAKVLCGHRRDGRMLQPTVLAGVPRTAQRLPRRGVRPGGDRLPGRRLRRRARRGQRLRVRPPGGRLHPRPAARAPRVSHPRGGRGDRRRRPQLPQRQHALRRSQGLRPRPRGRALRDGGLHRVEGAPHPVAR